MSLQTPVILCLAHLGWDFVWQRPQQLLARLARHYEVVYVNEPYLDKPDGEPRLWPVPATDGVTAWQPRFPDRAEVLERWRNVYISLVRALLVEKGWVVLDGDKWVATRPLIAWFYTPIPSYFLEQLPVCAVVYDIMDELANFKGAARDMRERETRLMRMADLVFVGGRSLYKARLGHHTNLHLFSSGVDQTHFARALEPTTPIAEEIAALPRPILGYYGVIDERLDRELLREVALRQPDWSIVLVGPVAKIDPETLPRLPNLHYLGQQPYARLPAFLRGFDVCLMPFALNEATRYIQPTKTLEYMAAHKPIVSTPIPDVVAMWGSLVRIAATPDAFVAVVRCALSETREARDRRVAQEDALLSRASWDTIAEAMHLEIEQVLGSRPRVGCEVIRWEEADKSNHAV